MIGMALLIYLLPDSRSKPDHSKSAILQSGMQIVVYVGHF